MEYISGDASRKLRPGIVVQYRAVNVTGCMYLPPDVFSTQLSVCI
jgi:hypothetical protein